MKSFVKNLLDVSYASKTQRKKEIWDVEGRLLRGNQFFKFDIRPLHITNEESYKIGFFKSKADKMVFETKDNWIIFDIKELHEFVKLKDKKDFNIEELCKNLTWNLVIKK